MVDIQSATAEIRRGKRIERRRNHRMKLCWSALFHRATIKVRMKVAKFTFKTGNSGVYSDVIRKRVPNTNDPISKEVTSLFGSNRWSVLC